MLAQSYGVRFNHVDDANKYAQATAFSRMKNEKAGTGLEDSQRVNIVEQKQTRYDPDGINGREDTKKAAHKEHLEKMFNIGNENTYKPDAAKPKAELASDHLKNKHKGTHTDCPLCECETCKNRRYVDQSNDSAVSFQKPTRMRPEEAAHKVMAHEMEHVRREQQKVAGDSSRRIISQSVQIHTSSCPECGKNYVSGGTTRTSTRYQDPAYIDLFKVGAQDRFKGDKFSASA
ncbi:MAG: hypothetical protein LBC82_07075 [Oscillospiraceae bacterium]|nr:hypothetical protein [Oscillospiraceae bacterium]